MRVQNHNQNNPKHGRTQDDFYCQCRRVVKPDQCIVFAKRLDSSIGTLVIAEKYMFTQNFTEKYISSMYGGGTRGYPSEVALWSLLFWLLASMFQYNFNTMPLSAEGVPHPGCAENADAVFATAIRGKKRNTYRDLVESNRCELLANGSKWISTIAYQALKLSEFCRSPFSCLFSDSIQMYSDYIRNVWINHYRTSADFHSYICWSFTTSVNNLRGILDDNQKSAYFTVTLFHSTFL